MESLTQKDQEILLNRSQAAAFLGCKPSTLALWKCNQRYYLPYVKIGRNVRYRLSDLKSFIAHNVHV